MSSFVKTLMLLGLVSVSPAVAGTACPERQPGAPYPWTTDEFMSGDKWADLELDLDTKGKVQTCRVMKSNMSREDGFFACAAMQVQGQEEPIMKDGVAVAGTIKTKMVQHGTRHQDSDMAARKRWFREHPNERWDCYPE